MWLDCSISRENSTGLSFSFPGAAGTGPAPVPAASRLAISSLERSVQPFLEAGLYEPTRKVYRAGWNRFLSFANAFSLQLPISPITPESVTLFVAFLGSEGLAVSTIQSLPCCSVAFSGPGRFFLHFTFILLATHEGAPSGDTVSQGTADLTPHSPPNHGIPNATYQGISVRSSHSLHKCADLGSLLCGIFWVTPLWGVLAARR